MTAVAAAAGVSGVPTRQNPFPGPRPYERDDAPDFTGRDREIRELRALIGSRGVVVVVGPSGCGKSSLLRAGVRPALEAGEYEVLPIARVGEAVRGRGEAGEGASVFERNAASYLVDDAKVPNASLATTATSTSTVPATSSGSNDGTLLLDVLAGRPRLMTADGAPMPRVLVIDQFEELFTTHLGAWRDRQGVLRTILAANDGAIDTRMVLVIRAEYLSAFAALLARLGEGTSARERSVAYYHVERLTQRAARDVMATIFTRDFATFPARGAEELARQMSREFVRLPDGTRTEAEGEFVEPLYLQLVCRSLWQKLAAGDVAPDDPSIAVSADINGELRQFMQRELAAVARETSVKDSRIRTWLEESLITRAGTRDSVFREASETAGMPNAVVDALEQHRLLRAEERSAGFWYELSHDRLVQAVQGLGAAARAAQSARAERGIRLIFFAILIAVGGKAMWDARARKATPATVAAAAPIVARATAEKAEQYLDADPEVASQWIREALSLGNDPAVDSIAHEVATRALVSQQIQTLSQAPAVAVAAAPDSIVAIGTDDGRLWVLNALASADSSMKTTEAMETRATQASQAAQRYTADVRGVVPGWRAGVVGVAYATAAGKLAVAGRNGRVSLVTRPEWKRERDVELDLTLTSLAVTPSADEIAVGGRDGSLVRLLANGGERRSRVPSGASVVGLAYRGRAELLAVDAQGALFTWSAAGAVGRAVSTALSSTSLSNATARVALPAVVMRWQPPVAAGGDTLAPTLMAMAPDASELVIAAAGTLHRLRPRGTTVEPQPPLACDALSGERVSAIAYSRSGASLIIGTSSGRMLVWSVRRGRCDWSAPGPRAEVRAIAPLAEGRPVVTVGANRDVRIWFQPPTAREVQAMVAAWRAAPPSPKAPKAP